MPRTPVPILGIDGHAHIFTRGLNLAACRRYSPGYDATLEQYLAHLRGNGLSHGVIVQPSFLGTDNRYLLDALAREPDRLRGVVVLDPDTPRHTLENMTALGVVGMRLNLIGKAVPAFTDAQWTRLLEQVTALGWHVEVQRQVDDIDQVLHRLMPFGCPIVVDHFGRPDARLGIGQAGFQRLLELGSCGQFWCKVSGVYRLGGTPGQNLAFACEAVPLLSQAFGAQRLVWGSDWPHTQHEGEVGYADTLVHLQALSHMETIRSTIMVAAPSQLFGFR